MSFNNDIPQMDMLEFQDEINYDEQGIRPFEYKLHNHLKKILNINDDDFNDDVDEYKYVIYGDSELGHEEIDWAKTEDAAKKKVEKLQNSFGDAWKIGYKDVSVSNDNDDNNKEIDYKEVISFLYSKKHNTPYKITYIVLGVKIDIFIDSNDVLNKFNEKFYSGTNENEIIDNLKVIIEDYIIDEVDDDDLINDIEIYRHFNIKGWKFSDDDTSNEEDRNNLIEFLDLLGIENLNEK